MAVRPIPDGYTSVTPYLIITGAAAAMDFYTKVFGAAEIMRMDGPDGGVAHAEMQIGNAKIMLADEHPAMGFRSPQSLGGSGTGIMLYIEDVDRVVARAVENGARIHQEVQDQFYGDRSGTVIDPFGHLWTIATHVEDVAPDEIERRMAAMEPAKS
jgi:PhnB protein